MACILTSALAVCVALAGCTLETSPDTALTSSLSDDATLNSGVLVVGVNSSNVPYGGSGSSGELIGFDVDLAGAIGDELGVKVSIVDVSSNGRKALTNEQADVVLGVTKSGTGDRYAYSTSYLSDGATVFSLQGHACESADKVNLDKSGVIVQADTESAAEVQDALGLKNVDATSTLQEAFEALLDREERYLVADAAIGSYFARDYSRVVRIGYISSASVKPIYAMTLSENEELTEAIDEAIQTVSENGELRVIASKWLGSEGVALMPANVDTDSLPETAFGLWD